MVIRGFKTFLKDYRIVALSVAFVIGISASNFIQSFVNDIFLPVLRPLISSGSTTWEEMILPVGAINLRVGSFLSATLYLFLIIILLYFLITKILRWKPKN